MSTVVVNNVCEYVADSGRPLDLSNAGSGALQLLLLLAFLYARPASLILLDEPVAHQHIFLQEQVYDLVRKIARRRGGQVIYEIENYLLQPEAIKRFVGDRSLDRHVDEAFRKQVPQGADLSGDHVSLSRIKASHEFLAPQRQSVRPPPKRDLYLLAAEVQPSEVHPEAVRKLGRIAFEAGYGQRGFQLGSDSLK